MGGAPGRSHLEGSARSCCVALALENWGERGELVEGNGLPGASEKHCRRMTSAMLAVILNLTPAWLLPSRWTLTTATTGFRLHYFPSVVHRELSGASCGNPLLV